MDMLNKVMNNKVMDTLLKPMQNKWVSVPLTVVLILYSALIAPTPPDVLVQALKNKFVKLVAIFLFVLIFAAGDRVLALVSLLAIAITFTVVDNIHRINDVVIGVGQGVVNAGEQVAGRLYDGGPVTVMPSSVPNKVKMDQGLMDSTFSPIDLSKP